MLKGQVIALLLAIMLVPAFALAQEKKGTVSSYDKESRMVTAKGKDWEQKAKVPSKAESILMSQCSAVDLGAAHGFTSDEN